MELERELLQWSIAIIVPLGTLLVAIFSMRNKASQTFAEGLASRLEIVEDRLEECEKDRIRLNKHLLEILQGQVKSSEDFSKPHHRRLKAVGDDEDEPAMLENFSDK